MCRQAFLKTHMHGRILSAISTSRQVGVVRVVQVLAHLGDPLLLSAYHSKMSTESNGIGNSCFLVVLFPEECYLILRNMCQPVTTQ